MDKKQYSRQGSSKALSSDSRKSSEYQSNKPWPKHSRRREYPSCGASKNDNQRNSKVTSAKTRPNVDKRPKARGGAFAISSGHASFEDMPTSSSGLALDQYLPDDLQNSGKASHSEYELNSVYSAGSKKQNLNHLLNFHYGPREFDNYSGINVFGKNFNNRQHTRKQKYNKEQFLQANFQFVVNWKARSKITSSPDTLIDWDLIEQINIQTTEEPQCPICLYPPIAAKLTRCGHAYCWTCILHYLALTDKPWRKCPICYEAVHMSDIKSTKIVQQVNFSVGDYINLYLMKRKKGSLLIEKYQSSNLGGNLPLYSTDDESVKFAKFLIANKSDVLSIIGREQQELSTCNSEESCPEFVFTKQAFDLLKEREDKIIKEIDHPECKCLKEKNTGGQNDDSKSEEELEQIKKCYYFYQSIDGQNIFLHPLNVKMLQACYGSLDRAPPLIRAKILQKEHHSMDEDHRRKFTCLGHLPLTCHFEVVEVQLAPPNISEDILEHFKEHILQRKKARQKRDREEKRREIKINAINDLQMGKLVSSAANINLSSSNEFPTCGFEEALAISNQESTDPIDVPIKPITSQRNTYSSVANSVGSPKPELWPSLGETSFDSPSSSKSQSWTKDIVSTRLRSDHHSECESLYEFGEEFHPSPNLGDVLAEAINQKHNNANKSDIISGNKKKKNKKMLLFSTGMNFNGK